MADNKQGESFVANDYDVLMQGLFAQDTTTVSTAASDTDETNGYDGLRFLSETGSAMYVAVNLGDAPIEVIFADGHSLHLLSEEISVDLRAFGKTFLIDDFAVQLEISGEHSGIITPQNSINKTALPTTNIVIDKYSKAMLVEQNVSIYGTTNIKARNNSSIFIHLNQDVYLPQAGDASPTQPAMQLSNLDSDDKIAVNTNDEDLHWELGSNTAQLSITDTQTQQTIFSTDIQYDEGLYIVNEGKNLSLHSEPAVNVCVAGTTTLNTTESSPPEDCAGQLYVSRGELGLEIQNGKVDDITFDSSKSGGGSLHWPFLILLGCFALLWHNRCGVKRTRLKTATNYS